MDNSSEIYRKQICDLIRLLRSEFAQVAVFAYVVEPSQVPRGTCLRAEADFGSALETANEERTINQPQTLPKHQGPSRMRVVVRRVHEAFGPVTCGLSKPKWTCGKPAAR